MIDTEAFIKKAAKDGWSRTAVCKALGISWKSLLAILEILPALDWVPGSQSISRKLSHAQLRGRLPAATRAAHKVCMEKRRQEATHEVRGTRGTIKELARIWGIGASTVRQRIREGKSLEDAVCTPPTPRHLRSRKVSGDSHSKQA